MTNRIQISAAITGNHAAVDITRQIGRGLKITETHHATIHDDDWIEIGNEYEVCLKTQMLITKVIREAMRDE